MFEDQPKLEFLAAAEPLIRPERRYKSLDSERAANRANAKRAAIKAAGGAEYEALQARERVARTKFRTENRERYLELQRKHDRASGRKRRTPFKTELCARARRRGRKRGLEATITAADMEWPSHCPVLGIQLDYPERSGMRKSQIAQANWPSLDRWDSTKGYVPGNVFVISYRANTLKNSATYEEILKVAKYLSRRPK